jgi:hypothetical protein
MASEDSDELVPRLSAIHRLNDLCDLHETVDGQVSTNSDELDAVRELEEVVTLCCPQRIHAKEGNDCPKKVTPPLHVIPIQIFAMVVMPPVDPDTADTEKALQLLQARQAARALHNDELV